MSTTEDIKKLREETSVSIAVCKMALEESGGDFEKAFLFLKKESAKIAEKKSERSTSAGVVSSYIHNNDKIGVLVEVRCETDFVARTDEFKEFSQNLAMHIAALDPHFITISDVPEEITQEMLEIFKKDVESIDKPEDIKEKILSGKLDAYLKEKSLYSQSYVKNQDTTVEDYIKEMIQKFGENIIVSHFQRFEI